MRQNINIAENMMKMRQKAVRLKNAQIEDSVKFFS